MPPATVVETRAVTKAVAEGDRQRQILTGVDCAVAAGELVALLGPSGSGKSTLLNLIGGIDIPTSGAVLVQGQDLALLDDAARTRFRRQHVGLVFQSFQLLSTLTVEENVLLPLDLAGTLDAERGRRARELLDRVGLGDRCQSFPDVLSGGEQQRVALARAVVTAPSILLADEPTGSLDLDTGDAVLGLLTELARERGCAVMMATHSRRAAARCDRVLQLRDGAVELEESPTTP